MSSGSRWALATALAGALLMMGSVPALAQSITPVGDERVTIRATGVPIARLLAELAAFYPLEKLAIDPKVAQHPVTVVLENVPVEYAAFRILKESGLDFAIYRRRVIVGDAEAAIPVSVAGGREVLERLGAQPGSAQEAIPQRLREAAEAFLRRQQERDAENEARAAGLLLDGPVTVEEPLHPWSTMNVPYVLNEENVVYLDPTFVPYKMTPAAKAARKAIDVATIP